MADTNDIKEYTSYDIDTFLVHKDSVLTLYAQKDNIEVDQDFEGVPGGNIIFGGMQIRKKKYTDPANGIWIGIDSDGIAKFAMGDASGGISWDGTTLTLTGSDYLSAGEAAQDVNDNATTISGTKITTGTITASKLNVSELSAISADIGSITSGTLTSALIRTSSSGARVEIDDTNDRIEIYDASAQRMRLDQDELTFYNGSGTLMCTFYAGSNLMNINTSSGASLGMAFYNNGTLKASITSAGLNVNDDILVGSGTPEIGSSGSPFTNGYFTDLNVATRLYLPGGINIDSGGLDMGDEDIFDVQEQRMNGTSSNPSTDGEFLYYDSGGTEGMRMQFGGSDFQFDATAV